MAPSEQPESSLAHARISLTALVLALFVGILVGGLVSHDPHLSTSATKTLFIVGVTLSVVCMVVGITILAIYVFKRFDKFWWLAALFGAPLTSVVAYDTYTIYDLSQTVTNISKTKCQLDNPKKDDPQEDPKLIPPPTSDSQSQTTPTSNATPSVLPSVTVPPAKSALQADGWVYLGTKPGLEWDEKYFKWHGEKDHLPEKGDILTSTGSVHLRVRIGPQAHIVGVICPDEPVNVLRVQTVADGHHWVQVKRIQEKEQ